MIENIGHTHAQYLPSVNMAGGVTAVGLAPPLKHPGVDRSSENDDARQDQPIQGSGIAAAESTAKKISAHEKWLKQTGQIKCET